MTEPFHVLFVCTANLCRSVTAIDHARRVSLGGPGHASWSCESAGTDVHPGNRLPPAVASAMDELGIVRPAPRGLTEADVRQADLILTAERYHRAAVAKRFPFAIRYTFTLLHFAEIVEAGRDARRDLGDGELGLFDLVRIGQSRATPCNGRSIDIADPVSARSARAMRECADQIRSAVERINLACGGLRP